MFIDFWFGSLGNQFIVQVTPKDLTTVTKLIILGHYAECHYVSLHSKDKSSSVLKLQQQQQQQYDHINKKQKITPGEGEQEYEFEKIVTHRRVGKKYEYLLKWKNWSDEHNSWTPEENIQDEGDLDNYWINI
jgi:hypothetical protein